ncbi:hypothetical protein HDU96_011093 [Phlyctochytrium bullatum]|nr:hypothetical protein HDU96_011093 [Phlyctochytrium bullatum]
MSDTRNPFQDERAQETAAVSAVSASADVDSLQPNTIIEDEDLWVGGKQDFDENNNTEGEDADLVDEFLNMDDYDEEADFGNVGSTQWSEVVVDDETKIKLVFNHCEDFLVKHFAAERKAVLDRLQADALFHISKEEASDVDDWQAKVTPADLVRYWVAISGIPLAILRLKRTVSPALEDIDVEAFVTTELLMAFYKCSPADLLNTDSTFKNAYNTSMLPSTFKLGRYKDVVRVLCGNISTPLADGSGNMWTSPMKRDDHLNLLMREMSKGLSTVAMVKKHTIASLDDDHLRLRSQRVVFSSFQQLNNVKKGLGPVHHSLVSVATGLYISGYISCRGDTNEVAVQKVLARAAAGVDLSAQSFDNIFALDRGYQSADVNAVITRAGGKILGTYKRCRGVPIIDSEKATGKETSSHTIVVPNKGAEYSVWVTKTIDQKTFFFSAHRPGVGEKVVLCNTSFGDFEPGVFDLVSSPSERRTRANLLSGGQNPAGMREDIVATFREFEEKVVQVTARQRDAIWTLMRKFRITGTMSRTVLQVILKFENKKLVLSGVMCSALLLFFTVETPQRLNGIDGGGGGGFGGGGGLVGGFRGGGGGFGGGGGLIGGVGGGGGGVGGGGGLNSADGGGGGGFGGGGGPNGTDGGGGGGFRGGGGLNGVDRGGGGGLNGLDVDGSSL